MHLSAIIERDVMSELIPELPTRQDEIEKQIDALLQMVLAAKREMEDGHSLSLEEAQRLLSEHIT
jgi:hypothetical protein